MTLRQIAQIKSTYKGLKMQKETTVMFDNEHWASVWEIDLLHSREVTDLFNYLNSSDLLYFIGHGRLFIQ